MNMSMSMNMFGNNNNKMPLQGTVGEKVVMTRSARGTDRPLAKDDWFDGPIDLGLLVILRAGSTNQGKSGQVDNKRYRQIDDIIVVRASATWARTSIHS